MGVVWVSLDFVKFQGHLTVGVHLALYLRHLTILVEFGHRKVSKGGEGHIIVRPCIVLLPINQ